MKIYGYPLAMVACLALAFWASLPRSKATTGQVKWWSIAPSQLELLTYKKDDQTVEITGDAWVNVKRIREGEVIKEFDFKANEKLDAVFDDLLEVKALKVIGKSTDLNLSEFGLDGEVKEILEISEKDEKYGLILGKQSFQTSNIYALDKKRERVILISRRSINTLRSARQRLFENRLTNLKAIDDFSSVKLKFDSKEEEFTVRREGKKLVWYSGSEEKAEAEGTWIDKIMKLKAIKYTNDSESDEIKSENTQLVNLSIMKNGRDVGFISLFKRPIDDEKKPYEYWVESNYLERLVLVDSAKAKTLEQDIGNLF